MPKPQSGSPGQGRRGLAGILLALSCLLLAGFCAGASAQAEPYSLLRQKARALLLVSAAQASDGDVAAEILNRQQQAQHWWDTLDTSASRKELWPDLLGMKRSAANTVSFNRLRAMALAYAQPGSPLHGDAGLLATLLASLEWLVGHYYNTTIAFSGNWWDWEIGSPQALNDCLLLLYSQLSSTQLASYLAAIDRWVPDAGRRTGSPNLVETGANRLDKALVVVVRGALGADASKLAAGRDAISPVFPYVSRGDGFYRDGSFIQHNNVAYNASYGAVLLNSLSRVLLILAESSWAVTDPASAVVDEWIAQAFLPMLVRGAALDNLRGRGISRQWEEGVAGRGMLRDLLRLSSRSAPAKAPLFRAQIKAQILADERRSNYFTGLEPPAIADIKALLADASVQAQAAAPATWVHAAMDRGVHHRPGFSYAVSMFSPRITAFEFGNGENPRGWYTGLGMSSLMTVDQTQYVDGYWATVDMGRLPGVTTDGLPPGTPGGFNVYLNSRSGVGGAALSGVADGGGVLGMEFSLSQVTGSSLSGRKSWFMLGDVIAALGSDINSSSAGAVETVVDNRKLSAAGLEGLLINGLAMPNQPGWQSSRGDVSTVHLSSSVAGGDIGYFFPSPAPLRAWRETRQGAWSSINPGQDSSSVLLSRNFLGLALGHGTTPTAASYAYMVLPGVSAARLADFAKAPGVQILAQSSAVHAVSDKLTGLTAANFWADASTTVQRAGLNLLRADRRSAVVLREAGAEIQLAIAEPTQAATGNLTLEWLRPVAAVLAKDAAITVLSTSPTLKLSVALAGLKGRSLQLRASLPSASLRSLLPVADGFVRDGSYAAANFGSGGLLEVKNDGAGYARRSLLKFDLSGLGKDWVDKAVLRLQALSAGSLSTGGIANSLALVSGNDWTEAGLNWNTQPAAGTVLGQWSVASVPSQIDVDITAAVRAAQAAGVLSLQINSPLAQGPDAWLQYGAREAGAKGPLLLITQP